MLIARNMYSYLFADKPIVLLIIVLAFIISFMAQIGIQRTYSKYKEMESSSSLTGKDVAEMTLRNYGINDVVVVEGNNGELSDFYDPTKKIVSLSENVYHTNSIAAIAIASHEVGHAIQHAKGYHGIAIRNLLLPGAIISGKFSMFILMAGFIFNLKFLIWIGISLYALGGLFQLVTLPVEFDASRRAIRNIRDMNIIDSEDLSGTKSMLRAAAFTYVAAFLATLAQLIRLISISRSRD